MDRRDLLCQCHDLLLRLKRLRNNCESFFDIEHTTTDIQTKPRLRHNGGTN
jgi:hypothetical protein